MLYRIFRKFVVFHIALGIKYLLLAAVNIWLSMFCGFANVRTEWTTCRSKRC